MAWSVPVAALIGSQRCFVLRQSSIPHQCQRPVHCLFCASHQKRTL